MITNLMEPGGAAEYAKKLVRFVFSDGVVMASKEELTFTDHLKIVSYRKPVVLIGLESRLIFSVWIRLITGFQTIYIAHSSVRFERGLGIKHSLVALIFERLLVLRS